MELKNYQQRAIVETRSFLECLATEQAKGNKHASMDAWDEMAKQRPLHAHYRPYKNGMGNDVPTFCVKVPTGGGKTLLATQFLGLIHQTILKSRNGAGLALWIVPSDQIYKDTLKALRDRSHFYRESLEFAVSRRIEVWEKHEVARLTPTQLQSNLNILLLKLAGTNRVDREQLKFFRDSGGNIMQHFPAEDEPEKHQWLKQQMPNLEMLAENAKTGEFLVKTSVANLVRLCQPAVILDEGHKATSKLARDTIVGFNATIVVELSATPQKDANILVAVTGRELLSEQMIKLPINIANSGQKSWKECLTQARDQRTELAALAEKHYRSTGRLIRPIVLVQVERTGKNQQDVGLVHSEHVKKHLVERLDIPESAIAVKTSEKDDIEGIDLLAEGCPVEWIITKAALQEGWDCPFAYILVSLNNTAKKQSMTQLVGRVLRQPYAQKATVGDSDGLNESYVFCLRRSAEAVASEVKKALEQEGYEGDLMSVVDRSDNNSKTQGEREAFMRKQFLRYYREFDGKVYLPRFCVKQSGCYEALDYFRHLISQVNVTTFDYANADWKLFQELAAARDSFFRITIDQDFIEPVEQRGAVALENDDQVKNWLVASLSFEYYSYKQLRLVVERSIQQLLKEMPEAAGQLALLKFAIRERIAGLVERQTDEQTHAAFDALYKKKLLCFYLECCEARFEIPPKVNIRETRWLARENNEQLQRSLFDRVPDDFNQYEKSVALYLDNHPEVLWWYRNLIGAKYFSIQGYRRNKIYPDFVVQRGKNKTPIAEVLVVESKGKQLKGNEDTNYKRNVADYFGKVGHKVPWQKLSKDFADETFRVQVLDEGEYQDKDWRADLRRMLEGTNQEDDN
jgi:type III restriction enzyme